jgi:hypothetical protein
VITIEIIQNIPEFVHTYQYWDIRHDASNSTCVTTELFSLGIVIYKTYCPQHLVLGVLEVDKYLH